MHLSLTQRSVLERTDPAHDQSHTEVNCGAKELQACLDQALLPGLPSYRIERRHMECVTGNTSSFLPVGAQNPVRHGVLGYKTLFSGSRLASD